jgi:hypothetical protein
MGLSAWERQVLDSIKSDIAGSDPELTALLSSFTRLVSGEEMPGRENVSAGPRRTIRRHRRARWRTSLRTAGHRMGFRRTALLSLWLLTTAALAAVIVVLTTGSDHGSTCTETAIIACTDLAPRHSPGSSPSHSTSAVQVPRQQHAGNVQAGP